MNPDFYLIIICIALGMLLKRSKDFPKATAHVLNMIIIWVALPAVIFLQIPKINLSAETLIPVVTPWVMIFLSALLTYLFGKNFQLSRKSLGALMLLVPLGNTSFLGLPVIQSYFGEQGLPYALIYDQSGSFLGLGIYGVLIISIYSQGEKITLKKVVHKALTFPPFFSLILALIFNVILQQSGQDYPLFFENLLKALGQMLVPLAMISVGFQFNVRLSKKGYLALGFGLFIKLVFAPLFLIFVFQMLGLNQLSAKVTIVESAMPPMITAGAIAMSSGLDEDLSASMVGLGLLFSLITIPLILSFMA